ncbi:MAG TPA: helix-turn-helix domain-containing protein [Bryobacteraceae bacterium]|nr:helix-turn-helix domain-containing protein [Bryobacteraceae bacterium]
MKEKFDLLVEHLLKGNIFLPEAIEILEKSMIRLSLQECGGNQCAASKQLGIHRNTLQRKMAEYGLGNGRGRRKPVSREARPRKPKAGAA